MKHRSLHGVEMMPEGVHAETKCQGVRSTPWLVAETGKDRLP